MSAVSTGSVDLHSVGDWGVGYTPTGIYELPDAAQMGAYASPGFAAELPTNATGLCAYEKAPIEMAGSEVVYGGLQIQAAPVELPHDPIGMRPAHAAAESPQQPPQSQPTPAPKPSVKRKPIAPGTRPYQPFRTKSVPGNEAAPEQSSQILGDISVAESQNLEMGPVEKKHSGDGSTAQKINLSDVPPALAPPKASTRRPSEQESSVVTPPGSHPMIPGSSARHESISGLSHVPSVLKPARGQAQNQPWQPSQDTQPPQRANIPPPKS